MKSLQQYINESKVNEGAGAGYTVTLEGLRVKDVKLVGKNETVKNGKSEDKIRRFEATLDKCILDKWSAEDYYDGVNSEDGIEWEGTVVLDYDKDDKAVDGGIVNGYVYLEDIEPNSNKRDYDDAIDVEDSDIIDYIKDNLSDFEVSKMVGAGWVHVNLGNPIVLKDVEVETDYSNIEIKEIKVKAPNITKDINWFFANKDDFDEIFGDDGDDDDDDK